MRIYLEAIKENWLRQENYCDECPLYRPNRGISPYFGLGNLYSEIAVIGEAPNEELEPELDFEPGDFHFDDHGVCTRDYWLSMCWEEKRNLRTLRALFARTELKPWEIYYANVSACSFNEAPNRDIRKGIDNCSGYLEGQLRRLKPRLTVTFGNAPMRKLIDNESDRVVDLHGHVQKGRYMDHVLPFVHWSRGQANMRRTSFEDEDYEKNIGRLFRKTCRKLDIQVTKR